MKKIVFCITVFLCSLAYSQQQKFELEWSKPQILKTESYSIVVPSFLPIKNYSYNVNEGLNFVAQWRTKLQINENNVTLSNVKYASISKNELKDLDLKKVPKKIKVSLKNAKAREDKYAMLSVSAIVKASDNSYKKVLSFTVNYKTTTGISFNRNQPPIINSSLNSGRWYKFGINKSGIYKLSKGFLNSMGVNTNSLDPRSIKIYGNGGQMIPYLNDSNYPLDPIENAIKVVGEDDGQFNNEDYVLFYGVGPKGIVDDPRINTNLNPYQDIAYYYLSVNSGNGKRIDDMFEPTGSVTDDINTFQEYKFHEVDEENIGLLGRRWFGDKLDIETTKTFDFNFPNLVASEPVAFNFYGASTSLNSCNWTISINGNLETTFNSPGVDGTYGVNAVYSEDISVASDNVSVQVAYDKLGAPSAVGYIDYVSLEATRDLKYEGNQFVFYNKDAAQSSGIAMYSLTNATNVSEIWDITDVNNISRKLNANQPILSFKAEMGSLKKYAVVTTSDLYNPILLANSSVVNQNIKGTIFNNSQGNFEDVDYIIITPTSHVNQAERLAQINRVQNNLNVKVLTEESIYNEFNTGNKDIAAIRNVVKYVYDNASTPEKRLKYLCLFGDGSVDYKGRISSNTYNLPSWNAYDSFSLTSSFVSDDFYGLMDDGEGDMVTSDLLDIAVGRMLADSPETAKNVVDKINSYYAKETFGSWRNNIVGVSDDVDEAWEKILQETTDSIADEISAEKSFINAIKIHSDAYQQQASSGGERYPEVVIAMKNAIENGALVINYFGHGGEDGLAHERILQKPDIIALRNECKLNCFVTITCEFSRFDNPFRTTAGELIFWNKDGGSVALITTTRQIFVQTGIAFNLQLEEYLFSYSDDDDYEDYEYPSVAEALRLTKNSSNLAQKYLIFSIGDPALKLAFPKPNVKLTKINDVPIAGNNEVLEALSYAKLAGEVTDQAGNLLTSFNGKVVTTIYDKPVDRETLANDNTYQSGQLIKLEFKTLGEVIFRGQATVTNGEFEFDFIVPKDISIPVGYGKVSFYASDTNNTSDHSGGAIDVLQIGGLNDNAAEDNQGPVINAYMNDENFVSGGITNESPTLLVKLQDENGINTASGIGHDITAILDGDEVNPSVLNNYYVTELDDYTRGQLTFPYRDLEPGLHTLTIKAWDVYNNSSTAEIQFVVHNENENLVIDKVLNYPNPFVNYTEFWFTHNSSEVLDISVQIFTISGKIVKTLNGKTQGSGIKSSSSTSRDIVWDGRDDFGDKIGKGTYIYKLKVHSNAANKTVEKIEKLVIL